MTGATCSTLSERHQPQTKYAPVFVDRTTQCNGGTERQAAAAAQTRCSDTLAEVRQRREAHSKQRALRTVYLSAAAYQAQALAVFFRPTFGVSLTSCTGVTVVNAAASFRT